MARGGAKKAWGGGSAAAGVASSHLCRTGRWDSCSRCRRSRRSPRCAGCKIHQSRSQNHSQPYTILCICPIHRNRYIDNTPGLLCTCFLLRPPKVHRIRLAHCMVHHSFHFRQARCSPLHPSCDRRNGRSLCRSHCCWDCMFDQSHCGHEAGGVSGMHAPRGTDVACRHGFAPAVVAVSYSAQLSPPDAAASTAAASVTRHGRVAQEIKPAGEGEQHEVSERVPGLFRPAATGPIRAEDPASGSTGRPVRLHSLPSRAPGDVCRLHLSRLSRHLRKPRAATVRWGGPVTRGRRVRDSTVR